MSDNDRLTPEQKAELAALHEASTGDEWEECPPLHGSKSTAVHIINRAGEAELGNWMIAEAVRWPADRAFIIAAKKHIPALLRENAALEAVVVRCREIANAALETAKHLAPPFTDAYDLRYDVELARKLLTAIEGHGAALESELRAVREERDKLYDQLRAVIVAAGGIAEPGVSVEFLMNAANEARAIREQRDAEAAKVKQMRAALTLSDSYWQQEHSGWAVSTHDAHVAALALPVSDAEGVE